MDRPLDRLVDALGSNSADTFARRRPRPGIPLARRYGTCRMEMGRRIVDLHHVLSHILRIYAREAAALWLVGSEPLLGGARPIDVLALEGAAPVIRAIDGITQGVYA